MLATAEPDVPVSPATIDIFDIDFPSRCVEEVQSDGSGHYLSQLSLQFSLAGHPISNIATIEAQSIAPAKPLIPDAAHNQPTQVPTSGLIHFDAESKRYTIKSGSVVLEESLYFPSGYLVVFEPGVRILLTDDADIISNSPFEMRGTKEQPVVIEAKDSTSGLAVISTNANSNVTSVIEYAEFRNLSAPIQGRWEPTGAVTFYESNITIANSTFDTNHAEDFLNIIRSDFKLKDIRFLNSFSDMIDVDFADGQIDGGMFNNCGNDCIDLSGAVVGVSDVTITSAGDKGISAGEMSTLTVLESTISDCNIGIASKDGSVVHISDIDLVRNKYGLASYQKKQEFGGASIVANNTDFRQNQDRYILETGSSIIVQGTSLSANTENFIFD
jgi:hypothetical protein